MITTTILDISRQIGWKYGADVTELQKWFPPGSLVIWFNEQFGDHRAELIVGWHRDCMDLWNIMVIDHGHVRSYTWVVLQTAQTIEEYEYYLC